MPTTDFDTAVMGGGPAGATTALGLVRRGHRVAVFESRGFEAPRYGETLPPEITPLLRRLALWDDFQATYPLESPGIVSVWGGDANEQDFIRNIHGCGWHIDRPRFDEMLWQRAGSEGAILFPKTRSGAWTRCTDGWQAGDFTCRFLVDARGRSALGKVDDTLLVLAAHLEHHGSGDLRTVIESVPDGWWYSAPLPGGQMIAMFFTDRETYGDGFVLGDELRDAAVTRARIGHAHISKTRLLRAASGIRREVVAENWLAVGDSAACHDPLSGFGVFEAIRRGEQAAAAIEAGRNGDPLPLQNYADEMQRDFARYAAERQRLYCLENRWPKSGFWRRRRR